MYRLAYKRTCLIEESLLVVIRRVGVCGRRCLDGIIDTQ